jgi:hypothetical protein
MGEPTNLGPLINDATDTQECDISHDGLELYFSSQRPGGYGRKDIWLARRDTVNSPWQEPINLGPAVNSQASEIEPAISPNGLELYFRWWDDWNLRRCTRVSKDAPWSSPIIVGPPIGYDAWSPDISADGLSLYFASSRGGYGKDDIWVATRTTINDPWGEPVNLGPNVNSSSIDSFPSISTDGLTLFFGRGGTTMWATTRKSIDDDWEPAVKLGFIYPAGGYIYGPVLSPDGSTLYFSANSAWGGFGNDDFWQVKFIPIVDFDSNGIVDAADMCIMIDNWHTDNLLCDIAPLPLGDGFVDVLDLTVLAEHLFEEVFPIDLIGYWKLNETEGDIAYNSIGNNHGIISGNPTWQSDEGQIAGALEFDGIDDYISTDFTLNPEDGPFSACAWIKGGAPGQAIISQSDGVGTGETWLGADMSGGKLMTGLVTSPLGRFVPTPLESEFVITDGQWHHIGFVWDGSYRFLYTDGVEVAKDTMALTQALMSSNGGLYIGTSKDFDAASFFSGLIDDVRIYDRAMTPEEIEALAQ